MALETRYPNEIVIGDDPTNAVFGTCMLGDTFGSVESASVNRESDLEEIKACGNKLKFAILSNHRFQITLKTLFFADVAAPGQGESINFPIAGVMGRILKSSVEWEKGGQRMLSIEATSWDSLDLGGKGVAYYYDENATVPGFQPIA